MGTSDSLEVSVPAKINLWLEVIRKRSDGYHDLSSLMLPIGILDNLEVRVSPGRGVSLECDHPDAPGDARNLGWRAAELYLEAARGWKTSVHIRIEKNIPIGAGLGGGSADAGAVLLALNALSPAPLPMDELWIMARKLGADVPFFLFQSPALATGIGDVLQQVEGVPPYPLVLVKPPVMVSTPKV